MKLGAATTTLGALAALLVLATAVEAKGAGGGGGGGAAGGGGHGGGGGGGVSPAIAGGIIGGLAVLFGVFWFVKRKQQSGKNEELKANIASRKTRVGTNLLGQQPPPSGAYRTISVTNDPKFQPSSYMLNFAADGTFSGSGTDEDGNFAVQDGCVNYQTGVLEWTEYTGAKDLLVECVAEPFKISFGPDGRPTTDAYGNFSTGVVNFRSNQGIAGKFALQYMPPTQAGAPMPAQNGVKMMTYATA